MILSRLLEQEQRWHNMKILEKADISNWSYICTCANCESKLEIEKDDLNYHYHDGDLRDAAYDSYSANCPVCKKSISVPNNNIPKLIKAELKEKYDRSVSSGQGYWDR